jgi:osmotically-inducible protein OsmY
LRAHLVGTAEDRVEVAMDALEVLMRDDDAIQEEVWKLVRDRVLLADAGLRVNQGVVGMLGRTQRRSEAEAVQNLVAQVPGVVAVYGQIDFVEGDGGAFPDCGGYAIKIGCVANSSGHACAGFGFRE